MAIELQKMTLAQNLNLESLDFRSEMVLFLFAFDDYFSQLLIINFESWERDSQSPERRKLNVEVLFIEPDVNLTRNLLIWS